MRSRPILPPSEQCGGHELVDPHRPRSLLLHELVDQPARWDVAGREVDWRHALMGEAAWDSVLADVQAGRL